MTGNFGESENLAKFKHHMSLRTFDPMKDQHPVKFLVDQLADGGIYEPLKEWAVAKIPGFCLPASSLVPVL